MLILPTLLKAAGTGLGLFSGLRSAKSQEFTGRLNYQIDTLNAEQGRQATLTQLQIDEIGIGIQRDTADTNLMLALAEADAQKRNAEMLRSFAEARTKQSRESIRRKMRAYSEFQGKQESAVATSGVEMSGSALEVMVESFANFRISVQDEHDQANFERMETREKAELMDIDAVRGRARARADHSYSRSGTNLSMAAIQLGKLGAQTAFQSALMQAQMKRLGASDRATGARLSTVGSLLSGVGGYMSDRETIKDKGMNMRIG